MVFLSTPVNAGETPMTDTIKTGTILIEEGALLPESVRFGSEPWTVFYRAGEMIRELRKSSGKQSKYGSEGNMAHSDKVLDHHDQPRDAGSLPKVDRFAGTNDDDWKGNPGRLGASECGEVLTASRSPIKTKLQMKIDSETQVIEEGEFKSFAWGLAAIASSSLPTEWVKGKSSRKRLPSRTRISSASSAFPHATLLDATRHSRIGRRLHLVGSPIF